MVFQYGEAKLANSRSCSSCFSRCEAEEEREGEDEEEIEQYRSYRKNVVEMNKQQRFYSRMCLDLF